MSAATLLDDFALDYTDGYTREFVLEAALGRAIDVLDSLPPSPLASAFPDTPSLTAALRHTLAQVRLGQHQQRTLEAPDGL